VKRIVLVGYRGTGKTEIGKELARHLNVPFLDTDHLAEEQTGREHAGEVRAHPHALAAATFGAEFTGPLPDEPEPEPELPPVPGVEGVPEEPSGFAAGLDSPPSDFGLLEE